MYYARLLKCGMYVQQSGVHSHWNFQLCQFCSTSMKISICQPYFVIIIDQDGYWLLNNIYSIETQIPTVGTLLCLITTWFHHMEATFCTGVTGGWGFVYSRKLQDNYWYCKNKITNSLSDTYNFILFFSLFSYFDCIPKSIFSDLINW